MSQSGDPEKLSAADIPPAHAPIPVSEIKRPSGWKYKQINIGPWRFPWYASPPAQLLIVSFVCFLCPGMFNALNGIGGGGLADPTVADNTNVAVYSTFSVVGFFAGTITNRLGIKAALSFGGLGYTVYVSALFCFLKTSNHGFAYFAGALLGLCAGLLWSAQGAIMMSYPPEGSKGKYIAYFWMIFNLGAVIGSLIPLGQNVNDTSTGNTSDGTYIGFIVLTFVGALAALTLVNSKDVIRSDGSRIIVMKHPSWKTELWGLVETFRIDPAIILLFPMFFSSNWFYTYQFNEVNGVKFNTRTTSLNNTLYWTSQIIGSFAFGFFLDITYFRRRTRAFAGWGALFIITMAIWGGGFAFQKQYSRDHLGFIYDWTSTGYVGPMFLYMFYGFFDAAWQTTVYWYISPLISFCFATLQIVGKVSSEYLTVSRLMGALTNNGRRLANYAGFYKGIQSAGSAVSYRIDAKLVPYMNYFASCWALLGGSLLLALPMLILRVKDHVTIEEDLKFSDETYDEVAPQHARATTAETGLYE